MRKDTPKELLGRIKISTSHYGEIPNIDRKKTLLVSISGGILIDELIKKYGRNNGEEFFYSVDMMIGKEVGPSWSIYSAYKNSKLSLEKKEIEYFYSYKKDILEKIDLNRMILDILEIAEEQGKTEIVFLCYEKPSEFCHRFIFSSELMKRFKIKVKELFINERQRIIPECNPGRLILR